MDRVVHGREEWHLLASKQNVHIGMLLVASFIIAQRCLRWLSQSSKPYVLEKKKVSPFFFVVPCKCVLIVPRCLLFTLETLAAPCTRQSTTSPFWCRFQNFTRTNF
jgi:hypothetical protein